MQVSAGTTTADPTHARLVALFYLLAQDCAPFATLQRAVARLHEPAGHLPEPGLLRLAERLADQVVTPPTSDQVLTVQVRIPERMEGDTEALRNAVPGWLQDVVHEVREALDERYFRPQGEQGGGDGEPAAVPGAGAGAGPGRGPAGLNGSTPRG